MQLSRRRFLTLSAALFVANPAQAAPLHRARGQALGATVTILLAHPDAPRIAARAMAEIARLERIFSLYDPGSELSRLNAEARLDAPSFELLDCLSLCDRVHAATAGAFDPTIQPLWASYARHFAEGAAPDAGTLEAERRKTGWHRLRFDAAQVRLEPGMALTLNGVAQGFIADRVSELLKAEGLGDILVDTGELRALGGHPEGGDWPVALASGEGLTLRDMALASSAPRGTVFDAAGQVGHILDPRTGLPAAPRWELVSVTSPSAALADALSTAFCLMDRQGIELALAKAPQARLVGLKAQA
ncbi:thiamine biosynthesis lipoprotein [Cereibacter changlensis]|uniref:FAD:protein FMN transferase n=2 Tax=Cereibacter changlensis TaxID=402884 RepID=A0A2W7QN14_9RHOB|nr:FAD:protein FMN transferase [Cereibacter changlensis]PZX49501.1 thiamine biosynthesis lipoprotein [Cereibacter changlensis]